MLEAQNVYRRRRGEKDITSEDAEKMAREDEKLRRERQWPEH
jgi:hypothetical protein